MTFQDLTSEQLEAGLLEAEQAEREFLEQAELKRKADSRVPIRAEIKRRKAIQIAENDLAAMMTSEIPIELERLTPRIQKWVSRYNSAIAEVEALQQEFPLLQQVISAKAARLDAASLNLAEARHDGPLIYPYSDGPSSELQIGFNENWIKVAPVELEIHPHKDFSELGRIIFSKLLLGFIYSGVKSFRKNW